MSVNAEPFRRELSSAADTRPTAETEFELPRGIHRVEIRQGLCAVHVTGLTGDTSAARVEVLKAIADAGVSIDFLKLTQGGLSFVSPESQSAAVEDVLQKTGQTFQTNRNRCIVLAHAANMRDEEGLIARVVSEVIGAGVQVDHLGDMHDKVLLVMDQADGERVAKRIQERLVAQ